MLSFFENLLKRGHSVQTADQTAEKAQPIVRQILIEQDKLRTLADIELRNKTLYFRNIIAHDLADVNSIR
jgi:preprotein translocase subunit SecA